MSSIQKDDSKSAIKSKKQKIVKKKKDKQQLINQITPQMSKKDREKEHSIKKSQIQDTYKYASSKSHKQDNNEHKINNYNQFNLKKLKKIVISSPNPQQQVLKVVEEAEVEITQNKKTLYSFKRQGNNNIKYVSENHLRGRATDVQQIQEKIIIEIDKNQDEEDKTQKQTPILTRYFTQTTYSVSQDHRMIRCYRCQKQGHKSMNCPQEAKQRCLFCLGDHHQLDCNSRPCFRCNQLGHISQECQSQGIECRRCRHKGHISKNCGAILLMDYHSHPQRQIRQKYDEIDLHKLKCLSNCEHPQGHFNCFQYGKHKADEPYYKQLNTKSKKYIQLDKSNRKSRNFYESKQSFKQNDNWNRVNRRYY